MPVRLIFNAAIAGGLILSWQAMPVLTSETREGCDASYPTVCIPPAPPDLNCDDIEHRDFTVNQPDPHRFDRDKDGTGCES